MVQFDRPMVKALAAEFLCTFIFIFTLCANTLNDARITISSVGTVGSALSTAFVSIAIIYAFGCFSGAHFNPAVTIGALVGGKIDPIKALLYVILQLIAAIAAVGLLMYLFPGNVAKQLLLFPGKEVSNTMAWAFEFILTFILVFVVYSTAFGIKTKPDESDVECQDEQAEIIAMNRHRLNFAPLAIGLTLGFLCFLGSTISGGGFNPARATAPALLATNFDYLWIYWTADVTGACFAAALYTFFFAK